MQTLKASIKGKKSLLDCSALTTLLTKAPGHEMLEDVMANSAISAVSVSELVSFLVQSGVTEEEVDAIITDIIPEVLPFTEALARKAGKIVSPTKEHIVSFEERACIVTALQYSMTLYTAHTAGKDLAPLVPIVVVG